MATLTTTVTQGTVSSVEFQALRTEIMTAGIRLVRIPTWTADYEGAERRIRESDAYLAFGANTGISAMCHLGDAFRSGTPAFWYPADVETLIDLRDARWGHEDRRLFETMTLLPRHPRVAARVLTEHFQERGVALSVEPLPPDLALAAQDRSRVLLLREGDPFRFDDLLSELIRLSRGTFTPEDVEITPNHHLHYRHSGSLYKWKPPGEGILGITNLVSQINLVLAGSGIQFHRVGFESALLLIALTSEEAADLRKDRGWSFRRLDDFWD